MCADIGVIHSAARSISRLSRLSTGRRRWAGCWGCWHPGSELRPQPFTVLGFQVDDVDATIDALVTKGVEFARFPDMGQDERGVWRAPGGSRVAWFHDPDGNTLSVHQPE